MGAGIAGLALAASLERFGITPTVVEITAASLSRGLALMLTGNAALALRRVGLDRVVIDRGVVLERIAHLDPAGNPIETELDLRPSNERHAPHLGITRDGLMAGLAGALRAEPRYTTTIVSVAGSSEEPEVLFSDGTRGRFDLVVGADGINSAVRKVIYPEVEPVYRSFCAWRTVMNCADCEPVFRLSSTTGCFLGSFPVGSQLVYAFLLAHYAEIPVLSRAEHLARLKELARPFHGNVAPVIDQQHDPVGVIFVQVQEVHTPASYQGRLVVIGDAAHAFSPLLAQGAAMAIEDAVALAESLAGHSDIDAALGAYDARRRPRVETIRAAVRQRTIARGMEGPVTPELLARHPPVFSASLQAFDDVIVDPFAPS